MIKLKRGDKPEYLDDNKISELTRKYLDGGGSVWNRNEIKEPLLKVSNGKCAYCEANIVEESKYMEVEHFRCKDAFPDKVVEWENLLPSCKRCNGRKGNYNVDVDGMIVNPCDMDPREHMYFHNYRLRWRNVTGRRAVVDALYLNDTAKLVATRMQLGEAVYTALESLREDFDDYSDGNNSSRKLRRIFRGIERLLQQAQPESSYSALIATILLTDPDYIWLRDELSKLDDWAPLEKLEDTAKDLMMVE